MKNYGGIKRDPDEKSFKQFSFQRRFYQSISKSSPISNEVSRPVKSGSPVPEWQLFDYEPEELQKQEKNILYVTDWQMVD